jgi:hypothetical protein
MKLIIDLIKTDQDQRHPVSVLLEFDSDPASPGVIVLTGVSVSS